MSLPTNLETHARCGLCALRSRRLFTGLLATGSVAAWAPAVWAQDGVQGDVGRTSRFNPKPWPPLL